MLPMCVCVCVSVSVSQVVNAAHKNYRKTKEIKYENKSTKAH